MAAAKRRAKQEPTDGAPAAPPKTAPRAPRRATGARSRAESKEETRDALIASAMALFAKRGLDGPSLDDICAHAGLTRGAYYVHFKDRDDLMLAVMDRAGGAFLEEFFATSEGGFPAMIQRFVEASQSGRYPLMPKGGIRPYQLLDACARSPLLRDRYIALVRTSVTRLGEQLAAGQRDGIVRNDVTARGSASLLVALIVGLQTLADLGMPLPLEELAPDLALLLTPPPR